MIGRRTPGAARLWVELVVMFLVAPAAYMVLAPKTGWLIPALWLWAVACAAVLLSDRSFSLRSVWRAGELRRQARPMLALFGALAGVIALGVWLMPGIELFSLPRQKPVLWAAIMVLYPLFSVLPQELIFRTYFFDRYRPLLGTGGVMVVGSAVAFGYVHVIFENWIAVAMTAVGGAIFAARFAVTRSLAVACVEHTLYGCLVFTIGLGQFFYSGTSHADRTPEARDAGAATSVQMSVSEHEQRARHYQAADASRLARRTASSRSRLR